MNSICHTTQLVAGVPHTSGDFCQAGLASWAVLSRPLSHISSPSSRRFP